MKELKIESIRIEGDVFCFKAIVSNNGVIESEKTIIKPYDEDGVNAKSQALNALSSMDEYKDLV